MFVLWPFQLPSGFCPSRRGQPTSVSGSQGRPAKQQFRLVLVSARQRVLLELEVSDSREDFQLSGDGNCMSAAIRTQFAANLVEMPFDCARREEQPLGSFTVGKTVSDQP